jgi:hypothetical protein
MDQSSLRSQRPCPPSPCLHPSPLQRFTGLRTLLLEGNDFWGFGVEAEHVPREISALTRLERLSLVDTYCLGGVPQVGASGWAAAEGKVSFVHQLVMACMVRCPRHPLGSFLPRRPFSGCST